MRRTKSVTVALWMLEHLTCGPYTEAISGDLLEGLQRGYSVGWYCRQVMWAIGVGLGAKARKFAEPLLFSVLWSGLYPAWWLLLAKGPFTQVAVARLATLDLPYSTSLKVLGELIPSAAFLGVGLFAYLLCHTDVARVVSRLSFFCGLSIGLNVLLVLIIGLSHRLSRPEIGFGDAVQSAFSETHFLGISLLLAVSLFAAILCILPEQRAHNSSFVSN